MRQHSEKWKKTTGQIHSYNESVIADTMEKKVCDKTNEETKGNRSKEKREIKE